MKVKTWLMALGLGLAVAICQLSPIYAQTSGTIWYETGSNNEVKVDLYFFWSKTCPHCQEAHPFVESMPADLPWLRLHSLEISENPENAQLYVNMAGVLGEEAKYVPAFMFCGFMATGYDHAETTGKAVKEALTSCHTQLVERVSAAKSATQTGPVAPATGPQANTVVQPVQASEPPVVGQAVGNALAPSSALSLPLIGQVSLESMSLPALTVVIAGLDAFNPCAFFVLMFLLSLMVHAQNRLRMLLIGGVFVFFSGFIYFLFMSAWLNVFLWVGELKIITLLAGLVAVAIALVNIKDYFWFHQGLSLSIPESAKPSLYLRVRNLIKAGSLPTMLFSTALLAVAANTYELLCTSGFPMVYTRVLTLGNLPSGAYYLYLAVYNLIYVVPLFLIVLFFTIRFGARKLTEQEGRVLKLLSGLMMLMLGLVLMVAPEMLGNLLTAIALLFATLVIAMVLVVIDRRRHTDRSRSLTGHAH